MPALRHVITNISVSLISLLLALVLCEGGIRLLQHTEILPIYNRKSIDKGDTPYKHLNAKLIRSTNPVLYMEYDPQDTNINNAGHRGPDFQLAKTPGVLRIAILGDSVAYGYSVPYEQTFAALLQDALNKDQQHPVEIYNFSVSGYSTVAELELYRTKVHLYQPDIVLLAYVLNDPLPAAFVVQSVGSAKKQTEAFKWVSRYSQFAAWAFLRWKTLKQPFESWQSYNTLYALPDSWNTTTQALTSLAQETHKDGAQLGVVVFPLLLPFNDYPFQAIHTKIAAVLSTEGIQHIDLLTAFSQQDYLSLRPHPNDDTHPNAKGHAIATTQILPFVQQLINANAESKNLKAAAERRP